jgi:hypothetical protein
MTVEAAIMAYFKETYSRYDGRLVKNCQKKEK